MKKTKKQPVVVTLTYPSGKRIEARIPLSQAYLIVAELEAEKERLEARQEKEKQLQTNHPKE